MTLEDTPDDAVKAVKSVLGATGLPLVVWGPGQVEKDNELLVPVAEATKGEKLVLGICEDKNYRTIVATAMANGHLVQARTPMDVNLAKQLNILITDMGMPTDRIIMDPTTGALGYGIEYGYSVMERLRLAALQGDAMTQLPMMVTPGFEAWKAKEVKGWRRRTRSLGRLGRARRPLGNPDRHCAGRIGRRHHRAAPPRKRQARQRSHRRTDGHGIRSTTWHSLEFKSTNCSRRPTARNAASPPAWLSP